MRKRREGSAFLVGENRPLGLDGGTQSHSGTRREATRCRRQAPEVSSVDRSWVTCWNAGEKRMRRWNRERQDNCQAAPAVDLRFGSG